MSIKIRNATFVFALIIIFFAFFSRVEAREALFGFAPGCLFTRKLFPYQQGNSPQDSVVVLNNWFVNWRAPQLMLTNTSALAVPVDLGGAGVLGDLPDNTDLTQLENHQAVRIARNFSVAKQNLYAGATFFAIANFDLAGSATFVVQIKNISAKTGAVHVEFGAFLIDANDVQDSSCSWASRSVNLARNCSQEWQPIQDGCFNN
jgi:hypothetical protein